MGSNTNHVVDIELDWENKIEKEKIFTLEEIWEGSGFPFRAKKVRQATQIPNSVGRILPVGTIREVVGMVEIGGGKLRFISREELRHIYPYARLWVRV